MKILLIVVGLLLLGTAGVWFYFSSIANPRVERELLAETFPDFETP